MFTVQYSKFIAIELLVENKKYLLVLQWPFCNFIDTFSPHNKMYSDIIVCVSTSAGVWNLALFNLKMKRKNHSLELLKCPAFNYLLWESLRSQKQRWQKGIFNWWWAEVDAINNSKIKWTFVCLLLACDFFSTLFLPFLFKDNSKLVIRYMCVCVCVWLTHAFDCRLYK